MNLVVWWYVAAVVATSSGEKWQWPEQAASVRIDTKVRFTDHDTEKTHDRHSGGRVLADEVFQAAGAGQADGFYNQGGGAGRYPVRIETPLHIQRDNPKLYKNYPKIYEESDGTLESLVSCKCVASPECTPMQGSERACGAGKFLCCYKGPHHNAHNTEYFNEIEDDRPSLVPGQEDRARPFPPTPGYNPDRGVLVGPAGPTGNIGPGATSTNGQSVLVGPDGPTGHIGPGNNSPGVLVGPGGPTGVIGPQRPEEIRGPSRNPDVLVGPEGPTNVIGPGGHGQRDVGQSESAQRGVLVGPGGPTGIIGPRGYGQRPVLVGPGGPTGIIGPRMQGFFNEYFNRQRRPGLLVGPGGPTGIIGPGRRLLVGPGGPTGQIGPQSYFI